MPALAAPCAALLAAASLGAATCAVAAAAPATRWSAPAAVAGCASSGAPQVLFPSDKPGHPTGPGALVWAAARGCPGGAGARVDEIDAGSPPDAPARPQSGSGTLLGPSAPLVAASSPHGQIAISGDDPRHAGTELLVQGKASGPFKTLLAGGPQRPPGTLATAYLGDLALLSGMRGAGAGALGLTVERWFANVPGSSRAAGGSAAAGASTLTVAMDFRSDAVIAWVQAGAVWVRCLPAGGPALAAQRLGPAGSSPHIAALLSDDNRAIVMWSGRSAGRSSVWMDYSAPGPRFGAPRLLERFADPPGRAAPVASPQLIRLSSESVMSAWGGVEGERWVVRTAPIDQHGLLAINTIAVPGADALLAALAPGPRDEAIALFGQSGPDESGGAAQALFAARGSESAGRTVFGEPEGVAPPGPVRGAAVAIEPASDRAVAVWQGAGGAVYYSLRTPDAGG